MNRFKIIGFILISIFLFSCKSKISDNFHMDKKYWNLEDYDDAIRQIKYSTPKEEGYPRISDPETAAVFYKLVDKENVSIVLEDEQLGLKHRNELAQEFFDNSREIIKVYQELDIQDKFIYPVELVKALEFNLFTQLLYFKVGNDAIKKDALNPDDPDTKRVLYRNEQIIVDNFGNYIEFLTKEDAFSEEAIQDYANMIDIYYERLIKEFPHANYANLKNMSNTIKNRAKSQGLISALDNLILEIDNKK